VNDAAEAAAVRGVVGGCRIWVMHHYARPSSEEVGVKACKFM
jgi:hypothetical protein